MLSSKSKISKYLPPFSHNILRYCHSKTLQETIEDAVIAKAYQNLPDHLTSHDQARQNPNPFTFLSRYPRKLRTQVIDEILQTLVTLRPRSRPRIAYECLLFHTLGTPDSLTLSLAVLQQTIRSGCVPALQAHLLLSSSWIEHRRSNSHSVKKILSGMKFIGYSPDSGTCNYLLSSLCGVDQLAEAAEVLNGMAGAGCIPDSESYDVVIKALCRFRRTAEAVERLREMVERVGLTPRQGTLVNMGSTLRANREIWKAVEVIEFLEGHGQMVGFECYESVVKGCLECREYILAAKVVMWMTDKGLLPHIGVRLKVVERLAGIGESTLATSVRQRFAELES